MQIRIAVELACVLEATARKPGNVHRDCNHAGLSFVQMLASAAAIGPTFENTHDAGVGQSILNAVQATRTVCPTNSNLGIILLFAPLSAAAARGEIRPNLEPVLQQLTLRDAADAYRAIRLANPTGLGAVDDEDVASAPTVDLRSAMQLAADRDSIARQYTNGFEQVFDIGVSSIASELSRGRGIESAIVLTYLRILSQIPDSHIARKFSVVEANDISQRAARELAVAETLNDGSVCTYQGLIQLHRLLLEQRKNPGTSADLTAAALFCALQSDTIPMDRPFGTAPDS